MTEPTEKPDPLATRTERDVDRTSDAPSERKPAEPDASEDGGTEDDAPERETARSPLGPDGMERPTFLLDFPVDEALEPLIEAFESGNYAFVREHAASVAEKAVDPAVRDAALELRRRIEPDPLAKYLVAIAFALLGFLVAWTYFAHEH